ncbi:integrase core domain-containing protein [Corynebacterium belfantii]|uniref:integrase core domain-containing protein n=1 Tax=Corynebacterium belfantii TaxID=2014537 RepID=UPI0035A8C259
MSALSTTSDLPSTGLPLPPELSGILMTMLWLKTLTAPHNNELIHTRRWDDVVKVEIATFEWVSWWNETRLHQSLGYRTPVEVETDFWKQNPPQEIIEIKANA